MSLATIPLPYLAHYSQIDNFPQYTDALKLYYEYEGNDPVLNHLWAIGWKIIKYMQARLPVAYPSQASELHQLIRDVPLPEWSKQNPEYFQALDLNSESIFEEFKHEFYQWEQKAPGITGQEFNQRYDWIWATGSRIINFLINLYNLLEQGGNLKTAMQHLLEQAQKEKAAHHEAGGWFSPIRTQKEYSTLYQHFRYPESLPDQFSFDPYTTDNAKLKYIYAISGKMLDYLHLRISNMMDLLKNVPFEDHHNLLEAFNEVQDHLEGRPEDLDNLKHKIATIYKEITAPRARLLGYMKSNACLTQLTQEIARFGVPNEYHRQIKAHIDHCNMERESKFQKINNEKTLTERFYEHVHAVQNDPQTKELLGLALSAGGALAAGIGTMHSAMGGRSQSSANNTSRKKLKRYRTRI